MNYLKIILIKSSIVYILDADQPFYYNKIQSEDSYSFSLDETFLVKVNYYHMIFHLRLIIFIQPKTKWISCCFLEIINYFTKRFLFIFEFFISIVVN